MSTLIGQGLVGCLVLLAGPARDAGAQGLGGGPAGGGAPLVETEMPFEGRKIPYVNYMGQAYRKIGVNDLRGLALDKISLHGLMVCVEGKFDRMIARNSFAVMGSDRQFVFRSPAVASGLVRGDNIWVGGTAQRMRREPSCYMAVRAVVRLKEDFELFRGRYSKYTEQGSWQKLLKLGRWMEENGKLLASARFEDDDRYRASKSKAFRQALRLRESSGDVRSAADHFEIGRAYRELLGRAGDAKAAEHFRAAANAGHREAAQMLREMGYSEYAGRWVTEAERLVLEQVRMREEIERARAGTGTGPGDGTGGGTAPFQEHAQELAASARLRRILEIEAKARSWGWQGSQAAGLAALAAKVPDEDEAVASRIVWILANTGGDAGREGLVKAAKSPSVAVRKNVVDALAWSRFLDKLSDVIRAEKSAVVRSHGVSALGEIRARESVDALIALFAVEDETVHAEVAGALRRMTGEALVRPSVWQSWWGRNRETFSFPAEGDTDRR